MLWDCLLCGGLVTKILIPITISNTFENSCSVVYFVVFDLLAMHRSQIHEQQVG